MYFDILWSNSRIEMETLVRQYSPNKNMEVKIYFYGRIIGHIFTSQLRRYTVDVLPDTSLGCQSYFISRISINTPNR
jgi:hypothetical protein